MIRKRFSFAVFSVTNLQERLRLETALISTIAHCSISCPLHTWLGWYSPNKVIRESGLWLAQGLNVDPLTGKEYQRLTSLAKERLDQTKESVPAKKPRQQVPNRFIPRSKNQNRYQPLYEFLIKCSQQELVLNFTQIDSILGSELPRSAVEHRTCWSNQRNNTNRAVSRAWMQAGYRTGPISLGNDGY